MTHWTAAELASRLRSREVSALEVAEATLSRCAAVNDAYGAFLTFAPEESVRHQATRAQEMLDRGEGGPLTGVPIAIKDNISTRGLRTTCASKILENYVPPFDATVVERLHGVRTVTLGKTNLDEFAMGASNERSAYFPARNPWDPARSPGGSSGGSAAAVAARMAPLALGSDTGGSIRQPAALTGIVGFKPTYGRVSRYGLVAFGSSLDQIGPMTRTVEDAALLAEVISGHDPRESTSIPDRPIRADQLKSLSLRGLRLALPKELVGSATDSGVQSTIQAALDVLRLEGVEVTEVSIPEIELGVTTYYIIAPAEASSNLARFDGVRYGPRLDGAGHVGTVAATRGELFGHEVKARIMMGTYVLSAGYYDAYYARAQRVRARMSVAIANLLKDVDFVVGPTSPTVAFRLGELVDDPLALKLVDFCTIPANLGGFPAISLPAGLADGLPVGLQLMGPVMGDERLLQAAYSVERALPAIPSPVLA